MSQSVASLMGILGVDVLFLCVRGSANDKAVTAVRYRLLHFATRGQNKHLPPWKSNYVSGVNITNMFFLQTD